MLREDLQGCCLDGTFVVQTTTVKEEDSLAVHLTERHWRGSKTGNVPDQIVERVSKASTRMSHVNGHNDVNGHHGGPLQHRPRLPTIERALQCSPFLSILPISQGT